MTIDTSKRGGGRSLNGGRRCLEVAFPLTRPEGAEGEEVVSVGHGVGPGLDAEQETSGRWDLDGSWKNGVC